MSQISVKYDIVVNSRSTKPSTLDGGDDCLISVILSVWSLVMMLGSVSCVTSRVRAEGVAAVCAGAEEVTLEVDAGLENLVDNCVCEKYHLLWPSDKVRPLKTRQKTNDRFNKRKHSFCIEVIIHVFLSLLSPLEYIGYWIHISARLID